MNILLTNHHLVDYGGSEIHVYELAKELIRRNFNVTIGTLKFDFPFKNICEKENINVVVLMEDSLKGQHFDVLWAHHTPTLYKCLFENEIIADKIIFGSLSPFEYLEVPPPFANECSLCVTNSLETKQQIMKEGVDEENVYVFNNFAPEQFFESCIDVNKSKEKISKVCIVSSHVPEEIREVIELLTKNSIEVDVYGKFDKFEMITPKILKQYDCVISIGKTVQYCIAMGIPVYCYDIYGGPGWINKKNISKALDFNFSGRGFERILKSNAIYEEIISGFRQAQSEELTLREIGMQKFHIKYIVNEIFEKINKKDLVDLQKIKKNYFFVDRMNKYYLREYRDGLVRQYDLYLQRENIYKLSLDLEEKKMVEDRMNQEIEHYKEEANEIKEENKQLKAEIDYYKLSWINKIKKKLNNSIMEK